ncbi:MAG: oxidoreductase [Candidatus Bathyarchaeota archaeon]|nr:MAG: oxidoreductase [Candidatus Bathyarchaeota archaeon]
MSKLNFAFYWAASCGGCEIAILDINEKILDVVAKADIVFWPVAMDVKYKDVEAMPDKKIDVCFFNGSIRNSENEQMAKLLRRKSKVLVAFGSCAHEGCIPGLANLHDRKEIFERVYHETPSTKNPNRDEPITPFEVREGTIHKPIFFNTVKTLDQTVDVDYYLPGCPPPVDLIVKALELITKGEVPPKGSVLAPEKSVCDECPRTKDQKKISKIFRVYEKEPEPETCLLEQGILCMGPATRAGCSAQCLQVDYPCTGCGGPCPNEPDQGAAMLSALASILGVDEEMEEGYDPEEMMSQIKDPVGTFYKYSLPHSIIKRKVMKK